MDIFTLFPTISTSFIVISAVLVAIGWRQIIKGKREAHKKTMLAAAVAALLFFIMYVSRIALVGSTSWGGPDELKGIYQVFLIFHIILATTAAVFGLTTITLAFKEKYAKHRKWGRITAMMWFVTAITGAVVYILLYLLYPGGHTKPLWEVIMGS
ncbi:DUF420 domain-containing protein [Paenibacillus donghaensis]|uniref:DUF420 domain-containing protein n=1 Tax=Paenibacillus donghaensis TaxID=414771 RepID=A0A2Z2KM65_9BACL|nr:DUF420 domain-containing protein [Paenibacillus donghaensis]ASA25475.1 hypothetical protein B9T62_34940 [Paenibacillus donghaensis]